MVYYSQDDSAVISHNSLIYHLKQLEYDIELSKHVNKNKKIEERERNWRREERNIMSPTCSNIAPTSTL